MDMSDEQLADAITLRAHALVADEQKLRDEARKMTRLSQSYDQNKLLMKARVLGARAATLFSAARELREHTLPMTEGA